MAKNKVKVGEFVTITARKVSDKVQPEIKVGGIYRVNSLDKLKDGTAVLVLDRDIKKGTTVRCNAQRFEWRVISPEEIKERQFKKQIAEDTKRLVNSFSFNEHAKIAFTPLVVAHIAWVWAEYVLKECAEKRIEEVKKLSRAVRHLRDKYETAIRKDLDLVHFRRIQEQADRFLLEYRFDFQRLYFSTCNDVNYQHPKAPYNKLRTFAFLGMQFCKFLHDYENEMGRFIQSRIGGECREGHLPFMSELETCFDAYIGNYPVNPTQNTLISLGVLRKNLDQIEFELKD